MKVAACIFTGCMVLLCSAAPRAQDAVALLRGGEYDKAGGAARAALAAAGEGAEAAEAHLHLGHAAAARGRVEEAMQAYSRAAGQGERLHAMLAGARLQVLFGDRDAGLTGLARVLERYRADRGGFAARDLVAAGQAARDLARGDPALYRVALEAFEAAIRAAPDRVDGHLAMADLLRDRFNNEEALEALQVALELAPQDPEVLLALARSEHFDHASTTRSSAERVLEINPRHVQALCFLATLQLEEEDYAGAQESVQRALAVNPRSPQALTLAAAVSFLRNDESRFQDQLAEARSAVPGYHALYETLAELAARNRRYERAKEFALLAVTLDERSWRGHALLGSNRLRLGDMQSGRRALERAFRGDPYDPVVKNALELLDMLSAWPSIRSPRFELVASSSEAPILAPLVLPIAEQAHDFFASTYGYQPETPIRIEFYARHEDFSVRTMGLTGVDIVGVSFGPVVAMDSPSAGVFGPLNLGSVVWHEIAHSFHLGMTRSRVPRWFSEGLAVFEERRARPGWGNDLSPSFVIAWKHGRLPRPSRLNELFLRPSGADALMHGYFQASLLMELIEREHGFEAIVAMLEAYREGRSTDQAIRDALGQEPAALDAAFDAFMEQRFGAAARALLPADGASDRQAPYPALLERAREAMQRGELDSALADLSEAQRLLPELAGEQGSYRTLARLYEQRGETDAAIAQLQRNLAIDADDLEAHRELARLHEVAGDPAAAAETLSASLLIAPFDPVVHRRLADLYEAGSNWSAAIRARAAVVSLDDMDPVRARYLLARAHHQAGDADAARRQVLETLESAPMYDDALELLLRIREGAGSGLDLSRQGDPS